MRFSWRGHAKLRTWPDTRSWKWRHAHALALNVYRIAAPIKGAHHISLRSQLIRSAMSVPTNIVEGRGQASERDFAHFLRYSINSASGLEYHITFARDIGVITSSNANALVDQTVLVRKMLHGLVARINDAATRPPPPQWDEHRTVPE